MESRRIWWKKWDLQLREQHHEHTPTLALPSRPSPFHKLISNNVWTTSKHTLSAFHPHLYNHWPFNLLKQNQQPQGGAPQQGQAAGQQDALDKGISGALDKAGYHQGNETVEKISDGARGFLWVSTAICSKEGNRLERAFWRKPRSLLGSNMLSGIENQSREGRDMQKSAWKVKTCMSCLIRRWILYLSPLNRYWSSIITI